MFSTKRHIQVHVEQTSRFVSEIYKQVHVMIAESATWLALPAHTSIFCLILYIPINVINVHSIRDMG